MNGTLHEENQMRERVINLIHELKISQRMFATSIGRPATNLYQVLSGERHFPKGFCTDVLKAYPQVDRDWLFFGDGEMFGGSKADVQHPTETRPRLPRSGSGGHVTDYYMGDKRELCQEKPIIQQFPDYDFTLILKNDRMSPKYQRGDEVAFKKSTIIEWGNDYLIDTTEGPKFKKIMDEGNSVRCVSYNKDEYPDFLVPKNLIFGYYKPMGVIRVM